MKLFCLPYAGGSAVMYYKFEKYLSEDIELIPVELSGKGSRIDEKPYDSFHELVDDITEIIYKSIKLGEQFALLGYSMGSTIIYEVAIKLQEKHEISPQKMFVLASVAPHKRKMSKMHELEDDNFIEKLIEIGGISEEVIKEPEILRYYLPIIRNDFKLIENYKFSHAGKIVKSNLIVMYSEDEEKKARIKYWEELVKGEYMYYKFSQGHFFINHHLEKVTSIINKTLIEL